jgi:hypothetical protein
MSPEYAAPLAAAGFARHRVAGGTPAEREVYRRPARGRWVLQAHQEGQGAGHVDVGVTLDVGTGALIGPVHRALSPAALAAALPHITASLEALALAAESLRCPDCNAWDVMKDGEDGPYLACGQQRGGRRPFDRADRRCRRNLVMAPLIVHRDPGSTP